MATGMTDTAPIVTRRPVLPSDVALAVTIPTSKLRFEADRRNPSKEFARSYWGGWPRYQREVMRTARRTLPDMSRFGARVVLDARLEDYSQLLDGRFVAVILMAHWGRDAVEFADGFFGVSEFLDRVPPDTTCILDLSICHPGSLAVELRRHRPNCVIRESSARASPAIWLSFYLSLLNRIRGGGLTYLQAFNLAVGDWRADRNGEVD